MIKDEILEYAIDDLEDAINLANSENDLEFQYIDISIDEKPGSNKRIYRYDIKALMQSIENPEFVVKWSYELDTHDDDVKEFDLTSSVSIEDLAQKILNHNNSTIKASKYIYAADDDEDIDMLEDSEDNIDDQLDQIADNIEDIQDTVDDVEEDDVSIDTENNIANHYIAECDNCHGVFITAVLQSDQEIEKISGICPICEKETDQYLNWVIKEV